MVHNKQSVTLTVRAMHSGAFTTLAKPCSEHELTGAIPKALALDAKNRQHD